MYVISDPPGTLRRETLQLSHPPRQGLTLRRLVRREGRLAAGLILASRAQEQSLPKAVFLAALHWPPLPAGHLPDHTELELTAMDSASYHRSYPLLRRQLTVAV